MLQTFIWDMELEALFINMLQNSGVRMKYRHLSGMHTLYGEGNGNPFRCSCLENPRDRGAWWASICGVTQSQTWLKRLSSSNLRIISRSTRSYLSDLIPVLPLNTNRLEKVYSKLQSWPSLFIHSGYLYSQCFIKSRRWTSIKMKLLLGIYDHDRPRPPTTVPEWSSPVFSSAFWISIVIVQSLSCFWLFMTPWTAARQASLSFTISQSKSNSCPLSQWCHPTISSSVSPPVSSSSNLLQH